MSSSRIDHAQSLEYWQSIEASDDGMLGGVLSVEGFSQVSRIDLQGSRGFLAKLGIGTKNGRQKVSQALEGGAGSVTPIFAIVLTLLHTCLTSKY